MHEHPISGKHQKASPETGEHCNSTKAGFNPGGLLTRTMAAHPPLPDVSVSGSVASTGPRRQFRRGAQRRAAAAAAAGRAAHTARPGSGRSSIASGQTFASQQQQQQQSPHQTKYHSGMLPNILGAQAGGASLLPPTGGGVPSGFVPPSRPSNLQTPLYVESSLDSMLERGLSAGSVGIVSVPATPWQASGYGVEAAKEALFLRQQSMAADTSL
jgi:hypothetical protein